ncbi:MULTISPECIES: phage baseplate assembly protein [unclassified Methylobacterium]|uniref:phage baseplate assembly protein domain-containing protein n=1 Tax=unclassified Methylobacterium TaxID=2615210 RepID=UPI00226AB55A|nr:MULTISPECIES: phage baseplate assembly protein [unclassified Methylobacterium]
MIGSGLAAAARGAMLAISRGTLTKADDSKKLQETEVRTFYGEPFTGVENWLNYGFTHVPLPPDAKGAAEVLVAFLDGSRSHPVVIGIADRRNRPKNLKPGESSHHDDQRQHVHLTRAGVNVTGKKTTITAGDKPATQSFELNEQLKGLAARVAQAEKNLHGLFDVTSKLREIAQAQIPGLAALAPILNQDPSGLKAMEGAIEAKAKAYLQEQVQQALQRFLNPNLAGLASLLSGKVEGLIAGLEQQIAGLIANNPVIAAVDDLTDELAALNASGGPEAAIAAKAAELTDQIQQLTGANPVIGQIANLRSTLQQLADQAGPALNFLEPQKRLVQGQTKSMRFGGPG